MRMKYLIMIVLGCSPFLLFSQTKKKLNIEGDFYYDTENFIEAEEFYSKSAEKKNDFKSLYNLGNSQEKQTKAEEAVENYSKALPFAKTDLERSMAHYNIANTLFSQEEQIEIEQLETVIQHYKDAIKLYPDHSPAKHNLASAQITLDMAKKQQEQQQQQQQQDQENQEEQDQEEQEQEDQQQSDDNQEQQEQKPNQDQQKQSEQEKEAQKKTVDKKEIENILKMVEKEDGEVQQKMRKQTTSDKKEKKKKW